MVLAAIFPKAKTLLKQFLRDFTWCFTCLVLYDVYGPYRTDMINKGWVNELLLKALFFSVVVPASLYLYERYYYNR